MSIDKTVANQEEIQQHLDRIVTSPVFAQSERMKRFLRYSVEKTLAGEADSLKESIIGIEVFDRPPEYDPKVDSIVRVEAHRLRQKLAQFYTATGAAEQIRIDLPKGSYSVQIQRVPSPGSVENAESPANPPAPWLNGKVAAACALALGVFVGWWWNREDLKPAVPRQSVSSLTSIGGYTSNPVMSPDGKAVYFVSDDAKDGPQLLMRQDVVSGERRALTGPDESAEHPDVSPNGEWIVYQSRRPEGQGIYLIPALGERPTPKVIALGGSRPRFSPNGKWILYTKRNEQEWSPGRLFVTLMTGGPQIDLTKDFADMHYGIWSEDGSRILFCGTHISGVAGEEHDWWTLAFKDADGETSNPVKTRLFEALRDKLHLTNSIPPNASAEQPGEWRGRHVYFSSESGEAVSIFRIALDENFRWDESFGIERLTSGTTIDNNLRIGRGAAAAATADIVFSGGSVNVDIWSLPFQAKTLSVGDNLQRLTSRPGSETFGALSGSKEWLAFAGDHLGRRNVILRNEKTRREQVVMESNLAQDYPVFSPNSSMMAFRQMEAPKVPIFIVRPGRGEAPERACDDCGAPTAWSPDGRYIYFEPGAHIAFVGRFDLKTRKSEVLLSHPEYSIRNAHLSPDGRWLTFYLAQGRDNRRIFIAPANGPSLPQDWIPLTSGDKSEMNPVFTPDGNAVIYLADLPEGRNMLVQRLDPIRKTPAGPPTVLQSFRSARRSLLRLTRTRTASMGPQIAGDRLIFAMDQRTSEIYRMVFPR
jgi:Tol biopolymer transport system component